MTPAGLRSLFRHHRHTTGVIQANPHRFRHTFATDMIRAGVSLPALMQLMGHAQIHTPWCMCDSPLRMSISNMRAPSRTNCATFHLSSHDYTTPPAS
jgi:Phage integrase family